MFFCEANAPSPCFLTPLTWHSRGLDSPFHLHRRFPSPGKRAWQVHHGLSLMARPCPWSCIPVGGGSSPLLGCWSTCCAKATCARAKIFQRNKINTVLNGGRNEWSNMEGMMLFHPTWPRLPPPPAASSKVHRHSPKRGFQGRGQGKGEGKIVRVNQGGLAFFSEMASLKKCHLWKGSVWIGANIWDCSRAGRSRLTVRVLWLLSHWGLLPHLSDCFLGSESHPHIPLQIRMSLAQCHMSFYAKSIPSTSPGQLIALQFCCHFMAKMSGTPSHHFGVK